MAVIEQISTDECEQIANLMNRKYAAFIHDRTFRVAANVDETAVHAKITLRDDAGLFVYPVEGRLQYDAQGLKVRDSALLLFDFIDLYFEEYLKQNGEVYLPIDWADYSLDEVTLQLRGQIINEKLERLGDEWLAGRRAEELH